MENYKEQMIFDPLVTEPFLTRSCTVEFKKSYRDWFLKYRWNRLWNLFNLVHSSEGFENWNMDFSIDSLNELTRFLLLNIDYQTVTEADYIEHNVLKYHRERTPVSQRTLSIFFDVSIYIGEILAINYGFSWMLHKPKQHRFSSSGSMVFLYKDTEYDFEDNINPIPKAFPYYKFTLLKNIPFSLVDAFHDLEYRADGTKKIKSTVDNDDLPESFFQEEPDYRLIKVFNSSNPCSFQDYGKRIKKELGDWFLSHIECRYYQLRRFLLACENFENWNGCFAVESLDSLDILLSEFFKESMNCEYLTDLQYSLIFDVAMYLGTTFILHSGLHWEQIDLNCKSADSGMMVIPIRNGSLSDKDNYFNPFETVYNMAQDLLSGKAVSNLREICKNCFERIDYNNLDLIGNPPKAIEIDINDFAWMREEHRNATSE